MPVYEFRCGQCDHVFELRRHMVERDEPAECPKCQCPAKRLMSAASFRLKPGASGGWADTGYSKPKPKKEAGT